MVIRLLSNNVCGKPLKIACTTAVSVKDYPQLGRLEIIKITNDMIVVFKNSSAKERKYLFKK